MGRVFVDVLIENYDDIVRRGTPVSSKGGVRKAEVHALVDTGSALVCLPRRVIEDLGLHLDRTAKVRTGNGPVNRRIFRAAQITILGREYLGEVMEIPEDMRPLVGYIPLENLDLVPDPRTGQVIPNPESGGEYTLDLL